MEQSNASSTTKKGQLVDATIQFSSDLCTRSFEKATESDLLDLSKHRSRLNISGLGLWNWCTREKRREDDELPSTRDRFFTLVRVLSFSMLVLALRNDADSPRAITHLERLAIKTGRSCIASNELDLGLWSLQKAVEYNGLLQSLQDSSPENSLICSQFEAEYYTLRIAWKEDRMDVAENLYTNVRKLIERADTALAEKLADSLFEVGRDLTLKKNSVLAAKWLERALELINTQETSQLSRDAIELRLAISQALIQAYLDIGTSDYIDRAENHIAYIEDELGDKLIVLLFRTEVLLRSPAETFDSKAYADIIRRMMRVVDISESSFKLLMHHIRKLDEKESLAASSVLDDFLINFILTCQQDPWIDNAITLRTHMAVRDSLLESVQAFEVVLDQILPNTGKPLAVNTAAGIQTLIWKKADAEFIQEKFDEAAKWCQVGLHPALEQSGPSNVGKMARKLLLCAIQQNDLAMATNILQTMNDVTLKEPMTAYLAFKVALKQVDVDSASRCLEQISEASSSNLQYLYACCLEAQLAQAKTITIKALQLVVLKHQFHSPDYIHLPALLRVLIRLEVSILYDEQEIDTDKECLVRDICTTFKTTVSEIGKERRDSNSKKVFTVEELDWFSKNAYNLGLKNVTVWEARHVVIILECCLSIISSYPPDIPAQMSADISLRGMFCSFMAATTLLAIARSEDNIELQLQDYLNMRRHVQRFHEVLELRSDSLEETSRQDLQTKLSTLLVFEFEGATSYQAMADCILRCRSVPGQVLYQILRELVNQIWGLEHFGDEKLAKYLRCLLKATLPMEHHIPLNLIEEISTMVKELASRKENFPHIELEWIIITAFNHGVELYATKEDELSKAWISHALTIAHYFRDGGELERQLQDKYTTLKWDDT
ncbi:hypothetical protein GQX73_g5062 [Xylaria multiplex]|uniref:Protein ZIP4 homolog n=1 Tax=Xylaria multiplex TaxID=323545 RepID=A0A7C8IUU2_9PEZI|nr:hypothetical protein GQX73_g5062 [Xylaria multiplex]